MNVLHDGPVPEGLRLEELSNIRAKFIAECDWDSLQNAKDSFRKRDIVFHNCHKSDEVVLWNSFELFDQLHLLQLLDCFAYKQEVSQRLSIIFIDEYLWQATSESQLERLGKREPVSEKQLVLGQLSWTAFTAPTPELMLELMQECTSVLPFLQNALFRLFEEFPAEWSGLPRTEHCILEQVRGGIS
tara:strand:+ start:42 stop:602 length:561 start_codon:yes stop_codon:yes gene_type:complete